MDNTYEMVNHPDHYNKGDVECIDAIKSATVGLEGIEAVCTANAIKYLWRWSSKGGIVDIEKAAWYLNRLHQELASKQTTYQLIATKDGVGIQTPWDTQMVPHEGDMFNPDDKARQHLLEALLERDGHCPCQVEQTEDTLCPCKRYREIGKCMCGLFVKVPDNSISVVVDNTDGPEESK